MNIIYTVLIIIALSNLFGQSNSISINNINQINNKNSITFNKDIVSSTQDQIIGENLLCKECIYFLDDYLPTLVKVIAGYGVIETCPKICGYLNKTVEVDVCETLCDLVGVDEFWKIFVLNEINPFYACQLITACETPKDPAANFLTVGVSPQVGISGDSFTIDLSLQVVNSTGPGQFALIVYYTETQTKYMTFQLFDGFTPGVYKTNFVFDTSNNSTFTNGAYPVTVIMCAGECGTIYSSILNQTATQFTINNPTSSPTPTISPTPTHSPTNSPSTSPTPTVSPTPTNSPSSSPSNSPSTSPTNSLEQTYNQNQFNHILKKNAYNK